MVSPATYRSYVYSWAFAVLLSADGLHYALEGSGLVFLKDIERLIMPSLSDPGGKWKQRPHVEMSYRDEHATLSLASLPMAKALPRAVTTHRS